MELLRACILTINVPYTVLFAVMILYWISVIVGAMDIEALEFDFGGDAEADVEGDASGGGFFQGLLEYLNVGEVPLTIILSFFITCLWAIAILANHYLNPLHSVLISLAVLVPNVLISVHVAKFVSAPFKKLFNLLETDAEKKTELVGRVCVICSSRADNAFGQAEIKTKATPVLLNVRTDGDEVLSKGAEAVIMERKENDVFVVTKLDLK